MKKVSREGIVLIKSFEGFRPRAVARAEGGWIIGYGHTLSAREGATVSETDAELLLRYDLLAVEKRLNETVPGHLNQHQFDALASFAFSVGLDRFEASDVLTSLISGDADAAAEAFLGWAETRVPSAGARRRAVERALFTADPSRPVALAALLAAPVFEIEIEADPEPASASQPTAEEPDVPAPASAGPSDEDAPQPSTDAAAPTPRTAAVAALLGETTPPLVGPAAAPIVPVFETSPAAQPPQPEASPSGSDDDAVPAEGSNEGATEVGATPMPDVSTTGEATEATAAPVVEEASTFGDLVGSTASAPATGTPSTVMAMTAQRYSPYGAAIIGPLPFLGQAAPVAPVPAVEPDPAPITDAVGPAATAQPEGDSLVLTAPEETPASVVTRPVWTPEERQEIEETPAGESLFGEDLNLTQGGQPSSRPDVDPEAPQPFDWSETGAFIIMGAVGLTAFGASMAAFRLASEQGAGDETSIIGWVLAVIGVACVGVSSFNLYRRFGLAGSDR